MTETALQALQRQLDKLSPEKLAEFDAQLGEAGEQPFYPHPGPQTQALLSKADILLYGGEAGGGKSGLLVGAAARNHTEALICRRQGVQLDGLLKTANLFCVQNAGWTRSGDNYTSPGGERSLAFAGLNEPDDWGKHAGIGRDYYGFDEAGEFLEIQVASLIAWARTTKPGQRVRVILASNPPRGAEGAWLLKWFAPWVDPLFPDPAVPGELRWAIRIGQPDGTIDIEWVAGPGQHVRDGEPYDAQSYTFIPASTDDNPTIDPGYRSRLRNLPEPLRSQLLYGSWTAGRADDEWQVFPTEWIENAFARYRKLIPRRRRQIANATDIAFGGKDNLAIAGLDLMDPRHDGDGYVIPPLKMVPGVNVTRGTAIAQHILAFRRDASDTSVDYTGGWGAAVKECLEDDHQVYVNPMVFSEASGARNKDGQFGFPNLRSEIIWLLREAMDPEGGHTEDLAIAPDERLKAEMQAVRYKYQGDKIVVEPKEDIKKRLKASTDRLDAIAMVFSRRYVRAMSVRESRAAKQTGVDAMGGYTSQAPDESPFDF